MLDWAWPQARGTSVGGVVATGVGAAVGRGVGANVGATVGFGVGAGAGLGLAAALAVEVGVGGSAAGVAVASSSSGRGPQPPRATAARSSISARGTTARNRRGGGWRCGADATRIAVSPCRGGGIMRRTAACRSRARTKGGQE